VQEFGSRFWLPGAPAQVGATLAGTEVDATGARVPGVSTSLTDVANGRAQTLMSIERGEDRAVALQPASYRVTALRDDEVRRRR